MKKLTLLFLFLMVLFGIASAQSPVGNVEALRSMSMNGDYYLTDDLEVGEWFPLSVFTGSLDGRGHSITIANGRPDSEGNAGLFGSTQGAVISNLVISGKFRGFTGYGGSLVGHAVNTEILNCETDASLYSEYATALCGGLVGCLDGGSITNSSSNATLEGYKMGGLVGSVLNQASIRNSYSNPTMVFSQKYNGLEVGFLVHDNAGVLENNYVNQQMAGWYIASVSQLCMAMGAQGICLVNGNQVAWSHGFNVSSSMASKDMIKGCVETGQQRTMDQGYTQNQTAVVKYLHDFQGAGYNIGDNIYIGGLKTFVIYVHEDGLGGWVTPSRDNVFVSRVTSGLTDQLVGYYNEEANIEGLNYEYAMWHDGHVAHGGTAPVIPQGYDNSPGKFFTYTLQKKDKDPRTLVNNIKINESYLTSSTSVKQLAYNNTGVISNCYYPFSTSVYGLVNGSAVTRCCRYQSVNTPYDYGFFGPRLYQGDNPGELALVDTLNGWVLTKEEVQYATWAVPNDKQLNDNLPIHRFSFYNGDDEVNTAIKWGRSGLHKALRYASINHISEAQTASDNTLAYYGNCDPVNADNVTVPWDCSLNITEEATLKGNYKLKANVGITFDNSDASGFAGANYDWHMFSTPLSNAPVGINYSVYTNGGPFNNPSQVKFNQDNGYYPIDTPYQGWDFYCYDEPNDGWPNFKRRQGDHYHHDTGEPINYVNETNLVAGKGYLWAIRKKTGLLAFGNLNNGIVSRAVTRTGHVYPGYNLIGNPYQAYLDFDVFAEDNATLLTQNAYTLLDADRQGYVTYCPGSSDNPYYAGRYLHSHQGFFVSVNKSANITFKTRQTVVTAESSFRDGMPAFPLVNLIVTDALGRNDYATAEFDRPDSGGALKMKGLRGGDAEIGISRDGEEYSIAFVEGRPRTMPVRFTAHADGEYTLKWDLRNGEFGYLHLIDHMTGADLDCLTQSEYVFQASTSDYVSRFKLVFSPTDVEEPVDLALLKKDFAFVSNNDIVVEGRGQADLFDLQGRLLRSVSVSGQENRLSVDGLARGIYLLRLTEAGYSLIQKILIP